MAASKIQANWASVAMNSTSITKVTAVTIDPGGSLQSFAGDGDKYPTVIVNLMNKPRFSVTSADIATIQAIAPGTTGAFNATHKDAKGAVNGDIVYVLSNAVVANTSSQGNHAAFGTCTLTGEAYSADGTTNPLAFTRA